jgi:hypothetical protein
MGVVLLYLWQPINDYFLTGTYEENIVIENESTLEEINQNASFLIVRVKVSNRGSVPVKIDTADEEQKINLFVFDEPRQFEWLHEGNGKLISDEKMFEKNELITIYPNSEMEVVKAIKVPKGVYQLLFTLKTRNGKKIKLADFVEQKNYQSISKRKMKND